MSVKIMSLVFNAAIGDLPYKKNGQARTAKASTVKIVLLAYADHANDDGISAYPSYSLLEIKTGLSRQGIADTIEALRQNDLLQPEGTSDKGTNSYRINLKKLSKRVKPLDYQKDEPVKPLDSHQSSGLTRTSQVARLKPSINHPLNHHSVPQKQCSVISALDENRVDYKRHMMRLGQMIEDWKASHDEAHIIEAIKKSAGKSVNYVDAILLRWQKDGYPEDGKMSKPDHAPAPPPLEPEDDGQPRITLAEWLAMRERQK